MSRISAVTPKTYEQLLFDAGVLFENLDYSAATTASELLALVKAAIPTEACLGATRGGLTWTSEGEFRAIELDDIFVDIKGSQIKEKVTVTVEGTFTQFSPENARRFINASDITVTGNITELKERLSIDTDIDYIDNAILVVRQGVGNVAVIDMENCINTSPASLKTNSKGEAEIPLKLVATLADDTATHAPYAIKWYKNTP